MIIMPWVEKFEDYKSKKSQIDEKISQLKKITDAKEKEKSKKEIIEECTSLNASIDSKLKNLWKEVDKKWDYQQLKQEVDGALAELWTSVDQKWVVESVSDWVAWDEKENYHTAKQVWRWALVVWWIVGWAVAAWNWIKWVWRKIKNFFWFGDDEEENEEEAEATEEKKTKKKKKKWFWESWFWKTIKYSAIWSAVVGAWYRLWKKFGWWGWDKPTDSDSDKDKYEWYEEYIRNPEHKEAFETYEQFWENVDLVYNGLYQRELQAWYQDELEMERIAKAQSWGEKKYKWIVAFCLDNKFSKIENILSQNSSFKEALAWWVSSMVSYVKSLWWDFMKTFVDSYLSKFKSWSLVSNLSISLSEKIDKWIASNDESKKELQYFFRQSIRIQTYLFEKRDQLIDKIAAENAVKYWLKKEDILKDKEKYEKYILKDDTYNSFVNANIVNWMDILNRNNLFNSDVSKWVTDSVKNLDKERDEVLWNKEWGKDILQIVSEKQGKELTEEEKKKLASACDGIIKDVDDNIIDAVEESAWNIYWDLFRMGDANLREYLEKSWLDKLFQEYKIKILEMKGQLLNWNLSPEKIAALWNSINNMLALKKEAILWANTIEKDVDENWNVIYRIPWFLKDSVVNLVEWGKKLWDWEWLTWTEYIFSSCLWTWIVITAAWVIMRNKKVVKFWVTTATVPASVVYLLWKKAILWTRFWNNMVDKIIYWSPEFIQTKTIFRGEKWAENCLDALKSWKISLADAESIINKKINGFFSWKSWEKWGKTFNIAKDARKTANIREAAFDACIKSFKDWQIYLENLKLNHNALYKRIVESYDSSKELREAVRSKQPIDQLEALVAKIPHGWVEVVDDVVDEVDEVIKPAKELAENASYKKIQQSIKNDITKLENEKTYSSWPKLKQIEAEIKKLEEFKNRINKATIKEVENLDSMYSVITRVRKWKRVFEIVDTISLLLDQNSEKLNKAIEKMDWDELSSIIDELRKDKKLKWTISDDMLKPIMEIFSDIKAKNLLKEWNTALDAFKLLIKFAKKVKI